MPDDWGTPPTAFHFVVSFAGQVPSMDCAFQEVSGIAPEMEVETVAEGGENRFVHQLPKGMKFPKLVLQRGVAPMKSALATWCRSVLEGGLAVPVRRMLVGVSLLDEKGQALCRWDFNNAYPVRWETQALNSTKNELAIERIELCYEFSQRVL